MRKNKRPSLESILDKDFHYFMEYDYDTVTNCAEEGCDEEGICRCGRLENFRITKVNIVEIAKEFCKLAEDEFTKYCIHRAVFACKLWDPEAWTKSISMSYYGEEVDYIKMHSSAQNELRGVLSEILSVKSNKEKLFIVLEKEYGYLLPELKEQDHFGIITVEPKEIHAGSKDHYKKLEPEFVCQYEDYDLAIGVGLRREGGIKLLDGYHRLAAKDRCRHVGIIVGEKVWKKSPNI